MRTESQFRLENGLALKTGSLPHEEVVEITGDRVFVHVEDLLTQVEGHGPVGPSGGNRGRGTRDDMKTTIGSALWAEMM